MNTRSAERTLRGAVVALFFSFGVVIAIWAVYLPAVKTAVDATNSGLGTIVLAAGAGAIAGMTLSGRLIDRCGSTPVALFGSGAMCAAIFIPLTAQSFSGASLGAGCFGLAMGMTDVGMNAAAVEVERRYSRPIMASFHGWFSIGTVAGASLGAIVFSNDGPFLSAAVCGSTLAAALTFAGAVALRGHRLRPAPADGVGPEEGEVRPRRRGSVALLGTLALLLMLADGSAMDWSSLHTQEHLRGTAPVGAAAVGVFVAAMTIGRLTADGVAARIGPVAVLRSGSLLAATGFIVVIAAPVVPIALAGWALAGLGLSGGVPQVFTAAGGLGSAAALSRVIGLGYVALIAGPATVGWLADRLSLNTALVLPLAAAALCAAMASAVEPSRADQLFPE